MGILIVDSFNACATAFGPGVNTYFAWLFGRGVCITKELYDIGLLVMFSLILLGWYYLSYVFLFPEINQEK